MVQLKVHELHLKARTADAKAPLFVLLHGFGASVFTWRDIVGPLSELGEVWAYDRPGFGDTERPTKWTGTNPYSVAWQLEFLTARVPELARGRQVIVVGHSAGGQIAAYFAATHPKLVSGLVLISPAMIAAGVPEPLNKFFSSKAMSKMGPKLVSGFSKAGMGILYKSVYDQKFLTDEVIAGYRKPLQHNDWTVGFWEFLKTPQPRNQHAAIAKITCPTLILTGDSDQIVKTKATIKLAPEFSNHRLAIVPKTGHISHEEKPQAFIAHVRTNFDWLTGSK